MSQTPLPAVFVSHGPPTMVLDQGPVQEFLARLGRELPRPRAILCVSAHWQADRPTSSLAERPETIHDFSGFDPALSRIDYPAPGAPDLARCGVALLEQAGLDWDLVPDRGLDHGAWEPLMLMYPAAEVPVVQLSLQAGADAAAHYELGRALAPLRAAGVLILASGTAVHNLAEWRADGDSTPVWARRFDDWLADVLTRGDHEAVLGYREGAPDAARAHPSEEHFLPLPLAMGAGGPEARARVLHRGFSHGSLSMAAFAFETAALD